MAAGDVAGAVAVTPKVQHARAGHVVIVEDLVGTVGGLLVHPAPPAAEVQLAIGEGTTLQDGIQGGNASQSGNGRYVMTERG